MPSQYQIVNAVTATALKKLPYAIAEQLLSIEPTLIAINAYTQKRFGESFWYGGFNPQSFNDNYRVIYEPGSMDLCPFWPFHYSTIWVERFPFDDPNYSAKFGIHKRLTKPLLTPGWSYVES
jgi:hypothetical protein